MFSGETAQRQVKLYYFGPVIYSVALEFENFYVANDKFLILFFFLCRHYQAQKDSPDVQWKVSV